MIVQSRTEWGTDGTIERGCGISNRCSQNVVLEFNLRAVFLGYCSWDVVLAVVLERSPWDGTLRMLFLSDG